MIKRVITKVKQQDSIQKQTIARMSIFVMASISPIMTIPQAMQIWVFKKSAGIFIPTWITYFVVSVAWLIYGFRKKDKPLFFNSLANTILNLIIVCGALIVHT